jgi:hypothetical protein
MSLWSKLFGKKVKNQNHNVSDEKDTILLFDCIDELATIGLREGFLSDQPGGAFDEKCRHIRTRKIGFIIAEIAKRGAFKNKDGMSIKTPRDLMGFALGKVAGKMGYHTNYTTLTHAWDGVSGWYP